MNDESDLYEVVDFILNKADEGAIEVIRSALRRREEHGGSSGAMGVDVRKLAHETAQGVSDQIGLSTGRIRTMVRDFVREMLQKQAPELAEEQIEALLEEWVTGKGNESTEDRAQNEVDPPQSGFEAGSKDRPPQMGNLPPDAILTMVRQFIAYSTGGMTVSEEIELKRAMPDWHDRYWKSFPQVIRKLLSLFLKGAIGSGQFWIGVNEELGLEGER